MANTYANITGTDPYMWWDEASSLQRTSGSITINRNNVGTVSVGTVSAGTTVTSATTMQAMMNHVRQAQADQYKRLYQNYIEDFSPDEYRDHRRMRDLEAQLWRSKHDMEAMANELEELRQRPMKVGDRYLNASDLLEEFFDYLATQGVTKRTLDQINIKHFVAFLVVRAAESDQETVDHEAKKMLEDLTADATRSLPVTGGASPGRLLTSPQLKARPTWWAGLFSWAMYSRPKRRYEPVHYRGEFRWREAA